MPTYTFEDRKTGKAETLVLTLAQREQYLKDNPDKCQIITSPNGFIAGHANKPDDGFRDMLREIKKANPGSTVDDW